MSKRTVFIFLLLLVLSVTSVSMSFEDSYTQHRKNMVRGQIKARGVRDELVLNAMLKVPRHKFVPPYLVKMAYTDAPLPIGEGQTISQPYIVAYMTEQLELKGGEKVLEVGTGSGYQAAILSEIVKEVYTIEIIKKLADEAEYRLKKLGYKNIVVKCGDGYQGWKEYAPFDAIIVTAAPEHTPQPLIDQLKENGKMIIPIGSIYQELILITKTKEEVKERKLLPVRFVPMTGEAQE